MTLLDAYDAHIRALEAAAPTDETAARSLACITLLIQGWRPGDPDPREDDDPPGGGEVIPFRLAA